ncbi:phospho-sugar mutase [Brevibacillus humidisoli]|uniref:phospho-sugar mutase n=1 Tax=Brevibacillus humidisoli TaxID=2895522 RepID=UPI001E575AB1|nr:phospho-sugar mutase [Brevibacillus humidisoli]UFJ42546.1 phospho-sugar mutase [Brevibacillus humidisoli]
MTNWKKRYQRWLHFSQLESDLRQQLKDLRENEHVLEDCFYKHLEFGTGGIRGEVGPGTNRMNVYTVRKTSEGLARYIGDHGQAAKRRGVVIGYDSRQKSADFAREAAKVLRKHDILVYLFDRLCPTPLLSFAIRYLRAFAGVMITASHNPPEYNGYKVYGAEGGQLTPAAAKLVTAKINEVTDELSISVSEVVDYDRIDQFRLVYDEILQAYLSCLHTIRIHDQRSAAANPQVHIVFTPLHGTSYQTIMCGLRHFGYRHVTVVREQADPDPNFTHAASLNPEERQAFLLALEYGGRNNADLLIATDPDADRLGLAVKREPGPYIVLNGNQIGSLLLYYLLTARKEAGTLPADGVLLKTIVTTELAREIATDFGVKTVDTLTGFKYIGEKMSEYEQSGEHRFLLGMEESNGYVIGDFVRDKDAIQTAVIAADMCAYFKARGKSLHQVLADLYRTYGFYRESLYSITRKGKAGLGQISALMTSFRQSGLAEVAGQQITAIEDYLTGERKQMDASAVEIISLPKSNVLKYYLADGSWFCLRPSGTEPKIKLYLGVRGTSWEESGHRLACLKESVICKINEWIT